jgi:hypothetical protein
MELGAVCIIIPVVFYAAWMFFEPGNLSLVGIYVYLDWYRRRVAFFV